MVGRASVFVTQARLMKSCEKSSTYSSCPSPAPRGSPPSEFAKREISCLRGRKAEARRGGLATQCAFLSIELLAMALIAIIC